MRIAVFTKRTTFHQGYGGLETQTKVLVEGLTKRGHDITVFSPNWRLTLDEATENNVKYKFVKCVYRMGPVFGFFGSLQESNWINRSVKAFKIEHEKNRFDIVLAQSSTGIGLIRKKHDFKIKVISIAHGTILGEYQTFVSDMHLPKDLLYLIKNTGFTVKNFFRRQRDFVHGSDKIIAVSNQVKTALLDETFTLEDKIDVIHNGIDPSPFIKKFAANLGVEKVVIDRSVTVEAPVVSTQPRGSKLLYVGQVTTSKGLEDLYKMFKQKEFENLEIDIVGSGDYLKPLEELLQKDDRLKKRIRLIGKIPYENVINDYFLNSQYGVFVMPTKRIEGFPMVLVEAMFSRLPIVAYSRGGVGDAVENEVTGYLIPPDKKAIFMEKTLKLVENQTLRDVFGENAYKKATKDLTIDAMLDKYEKVIKEVLV